jgi:membrane-bound lytic murein transglycosylase D
MFQLMPATARRFGLSVGWLADDRKHAEKSATAAAKYLTALHRQFRDWRLALAAYNCGEGRVAALMKKHRVTTFDALAPHLPAETQMYVPKVEATLLKREGRWLARLPAPGK